VAGQDLQNTATHRDRGHMSLDLPSPCSPQVGGRFEYLLTDKKQRRQIVGPPARSLRFDAAWWRAQPTIDIIRENERVSQCQQVACNERGCLACACCGRTAPARRGCFQKGFDVEGSVEGSASKEALAAAAAGPAVGGYPLAVAGPHQLGRWRARAPADGHS